MLKFVWLLGICKYKMAAFKYLINTIDINNTGQRYLIRNREKGGIGANMTSWFSRKTPQMGIYNDGTPSEASQSQQHEDSRHYYDICSSYDPAMQSTKR